MSLKTFTLALAVTGLAANLYLKSRRDGGAANAPAAGGDDAAKSDAASPAMMGLPGVGADSPNAAERLQDSNLEPAYAGTGAATPSAGMGPGAAESLASASGAAGASTSDPEAAPIAPGLPDFFRGA
jgi:hypothetical protein